MSDYEENKSSVPENSIEELVEEATDEITTETAVLPDSRQESEESSLSSETAVEEIESKKKSLKLPILIGSIVAIAAIAVFVLVILPSIKYSSAEKEFAAGNYFVAMEKFSSLGNYKDSAEKAALSEKIGHYQAAEELMSSKNYEDANAEYQLAGDYEDAAKKATLSEKAAHYQKAESLMNSENFADAFAEYQLAGDYEDAADKAILSDKASHYQTAEALVASENYADAYDEYLLAEDYKDAEEKAISSEKASHYQTAEALMSSEQYAEAHEEYLLADDYEDAADKAKYSDKASHYQAGEALLSSEKYDQAWEEYKKAGDYDDASQKIATCAEKLLAAEKYTDAGKAYEAAGNSKYAAYCNGMAAFSKGDYTTAKQKFTSAGDVENAEKMVNASILMQAEAFYKDGHLSNAKYYYSQLPEGFKYNKIDSSKRLALLDKYSDFVDICGQWRCRSMDLSARQTSKSTGAWNAWDYEVEYDFNLDITCVINSDSSVSVNAKANFILFTNYSSLSQNLDWSYKSDTFKYTGSSFPSKITLDYTNSSGQDVYGTLTLSPKNFELDYQINVENYSVYFDYLYSTSGTYNTFVKAY